MAIMINNADFMQVFLVLICLGVCSILALLAGVWAYENTPEQKRRRALNYQARLDYKNARGTAHLKLLRQARQRLRKLGAQQKAELSRAKSYLAQLEQEQQEALRVTLEHEIVQNHLQEVPGIGVNLKKHIIASAFSSRISDLRYAQRRVSGIGSTRQIALNNWISHYEQQIPQMLAGDFPGKSQVIQQYGEKSRDLHVRIGYLEQYLIKLDSLVKQVTRIIQQLSAITARDFRLALERPDKTNAELEAYIKGAFSEWEPMPGWFKDALTEGKLHA